MENSLIYVKFLMVGWHQAKSEGANFDYKIWEVEFEAYN